MSIKIIDENTAEVETKQKRIVDLRAMRNEIKQETERLKLLEKISDREKIKEWNDNNTKWSKDRINFLKEELKKYEV